MTALEQFKKKYGREGASLILRKLAELYIDEPMVRALAFELASDLEDVTSANP